MDKRTAQIDIERSPSAAARWKPLLSGTARRDALDAVAAIAVDAAGAIRSWGDRHPYPTGVNAHSLACGRGGAALFYAYCSAFDLLPGAGAIAAELLEEAFEGVAESTPDASLFCGFTGVAWVTEHLSQARALHPGPAVDGADAAVDDDGSEDSNSDIDAALLEFVASRPADAEFDLIDGLTGIGVYALERRHRPAAAELLASVLAWLGDLARSAGAGLAWATPISRYARQGLPPEAQRLFNLGLAHGQPGPIALLGESFATNAAPQSILPVLDSAVTWLLSTQLPPDALSRFPSHAGPDVEPLAARCAWCYGDPGVAIALLVAAQGARRPDWQQQAIAIALHAARCRAQRDDVRDAGLCHGSAGVGHIFNRIYQATGEEEIAAAARYWFERALAQRCPGDGVAGFRTWSLERTQEGEWIDDPRFLTGVTGTGLALLAAASDIEPAWDRCMLTCARPLPDAAR